MEQRTVPEAWLRSLWHRRCFDSYPLFTTDGRPVAIHRTGIPNGDAGPDFLDALLRIGHTMYRGDVEIHVSATDWEIHRHGTDPHYNRVVLHAALSPPRQEARTASGRIIPLLLLPPLHELPDPPELPRAIPFPGLPPLHCAEATRPAPSTLRHHLQRFGFLRMQRKMEEYDERFRELRVEFGSREDLDRRPWEQLLYEGMCEGLGYAKNREPFLALARNVPIHLLQSYDLNDSRTMRAILFGAAGLLPTRPGEFDRDTRIELRALRSIWRKIRPQLPIPILHEGEWRFFRLRPVNFPTARLAAWSTLLPRLFGAGGMEAIFALLAGPGLSIADRHRRLRELLTAPVSGYWSRHYRFDDDLSPCGAAIGRARANDMIVNALIPAGLLRTRIFRQRKGEQIVHLLYRTLPPLQQNRFLALLQRDLLRGGVPLATAALQQGGLELYRTRCRDGRCGECPVRPAGERQNVIPMLIGR